MLFNSYLENCRRGRYIKFYFLVLTRRRKGKEEGMKLKSRSSNLRPGNASMFRSGRSVHTSAPLPFLLRCDTSFRLTSRTSGGPLAPIRLRLWDLLDLQSGSSSVVTHGYFVSSALRASCLLSYLSL